MKQVTKNELIAMAAGYKDAAIGEMVCRTGSRVQQVRRSGNWPVSMLQKLAEAMQCEITDMPKPTRLGRPRKEKQNG